MNFSAFEDFSNLFNVALQCSKVKLLIRWSLFLQYNSANRNKTQILNTCKYHV